VHSIGNLGLMMQLNLTIFGEGLEPQQWLL